MEGGLPVRCPFGHHLQVNRSDGWPPNPRKRVDRIPPIGRLAVTTRSDLVRHTDRARIGRGRKAQLLLA